MANVSTYLAKILAAVYGEEVRQSIHDAIAAMNVESSQAIQDSSNAKNSAMAYAAQAGQSASAAAGSASAAHASETKVMRRIRRYSLSQQSSLRWLRHARLGTGLLRQLSQRRQPGSTRSAHRLLRKLPRRRQLMRTALLSWLCGRKRMRSRARQRQKRLKSARPLSRSRPGSLKPLPEITRRRCWRS